MKLLVNCIIEKELYHLPPLMAVVVARINGTNKEIPRAFKLLKENNFQIATHLKRIKYNDGGMDCIICRLKLTPDKDNELHNEDEIKQIKARFSNENIFTDYRIAHVPSKAPKTNHQFKACSEIWPCKFAKCNYLISCIQGSLVNESERLVLKIIVDNVLKCIKESEQDKKVESAAVVFRCAKIYGVGMTSSDEVIRDPVQHSTMASIDSVARNAGGGHWQCSKKSDTLQRNIQEQLDKQKELQDHRIDAHFLPYLCTNYDIFVTEEPCLMCTMGLVQSRIRRLFFLDSASTKNANCKQICYPDRAIQDFLLHRDKNLNHRFEAWRVTLIPDKDYD